MTKQEIIEAIKVLTEVIKVNNAIRMIFTVCFIEFIVFQIGKGAFSNVIFLALLLIWY